MFIVFSGRIKVNTEFFNIQKEWFLWNRKRENKKGQSLSMGFKGARKKNKTKNEFNSNYHIDQTKREEVEQLFV